MPYHLTIATDHSHKHLQGSYFGSRNGFGHVVLQGRLSRCFSQNRKKAKSIPDALFVRGFKSITSKMFRKEVFYYVSQLPDVYYLGLTSFSPLLQDFPPGLCNETSTPAHFIQS